MSTIFADTSYWVARLNPRDKWHHIAAGADLPSGETRLVTTQECLNELLAMFRRRGAGLRRAAARLVRELIEGDLVQVIPQSNDSFMAGLTLYEARLDKDYSLTDCISMWVMREHGIRQALTTDHHFEQEGFTMMLEESSV